MNFSEYALNIGANSHLTLYSTFGMLLLCFDMLLNVVDKKYDFGILICGTGIGIGIAANKVKGVRAALCHDTFSAHASREHNNANILTMGERVIGQALALDIVDTFLGAQFEGGRHQSRIDKITQLEEKYLDLEEEN